MSKEIKRLGEHTRPNRAVMERELRRIAAFDRWYPIFWLFGFTLLTGVYLVQRCS